MELSIVDKRRERRNDFICICILCTALFIAMYVLLGFWENGLDAPFGYAGGDEFTTYIGNKIVLRNGWIWFSDDIGAPYGSALLDRVSFNLMNLEFLLLKIIGIFTNKDVIVSTNIQILLIFPFCAATAFAVLRELGIKRIYALFGAFLFSCSPYILCRGSAHFPLTACYLVPISILLCVWVSQTEDDRYLCFEKGFFRYKKNWVTILFAALIANNGIGYYPFFTCVLLCICAVRCVLVERKISAAKKSVLSVLMIGVFFLVALSPSLVYRITHGTNPCEAHFYSSDMESVGLKLVQFFIPTNDHGISFLRWFIDRYNTNMPLVNENFTAYLGIGGGMGFLLSLTGVLIARNTDEADDRLHLYSVLNIGAFMYATIGGISSIIATFIGFYMMRSFNRMSIYIMFISICTLCYFLQKIDISVSKCRRNRTVKRGVWYAGLLVFVCLCAFDLLPTYGVYGAMISASKTEYEIDERFVNEIEGQLNEGDMVYQLPYHPYPEAGPVNMMSDYHLFIGYLHSQSLKWSYGGIHGRESDMWNKAVNYLPMELRVGEIIRAGFRGIYIDTRAYTPEQLSELCNSIENVIGASPIVSENGNLLFYNLYPYIEIEPQVLTGEAFYNYKLGNEIWFDGTEWDAHINFIDGFYDTEVGFAWTKGTEATFKAVFKDDVDNDLLMRLYLSGVFSPPQRLSISCGDIVLFDQVITTVAEPLMIHIPSNCVSNRELKLSIHFPDAISPKDLGQSGDSRDLAFAVRGFSIVYED